MSVSLSSGKDLQTIRVTSRPNAPKPSPPIKSSCFHSVFYRRRALPFPSSSALCCPRNETDILRALNAKKCQHDMKTERSYHPQNGFETKRRLLTLPHKIVWIVICVAALKAIGTSEEWTAILTLLAVFYLVHATLQMVLRILFYLIRWLCIAAALARIVCGLLF